MVGARGARIWLSLGPRGAFIFGWGGGRRPHFFRVVVSSPSSPPSPSPSLSSANGGVGGDGDGDGGGVSASGLNSSSNGLRLSNSSIS